ncbi:MAG: hypothetical protein A3H31_07915 [Gallionellales bacterium RIFCSPLOWO2_02_FULL_57_47]|nr:MAG: hypothetical protein A3H31_07915 [Gallionellales bacterium RIFCSPLOWO2_02_FULL_57_47]OGT08177.1 MAG: hypothetical protein A3J49_01810 [Gallionellales bacterium RIFCSPHIGHO2_02_FULL_57_16]
MIIERHESDRRQHSRYSVDWMASLMPKGQDNDEIFHDRISDLSLYGAGIYSNTELSTDVPMVLLIESPLPDGEFRKVIIGIDCAVRNSLFSEERRQFRAGLQFLGFRGIDKHLIAEALLTRGESVIRRTRRKSDSWLN